MKVYISGPITGVHLDNEPAFRRAQAQLLELGYKPIVPHDLDSIRPGKTWGECLGRDIEYIANQGIEGIVLLPGWRESRGAKLELSLALILKLKIMEFIPDNGPQLMSSVVAGFMLGDSF